jgi:predicted nucleic acid-binding Zn ribbon protein
MTTNSVTAKRIRLAAAIERDLLRPTYKPQSAPTCFVCGRPYSKGDGRFCASKCREAFDRGATPYEVPRDLMLVPMRDWKIVAGPPGVEIGASYYAPLLDRKRPKQAGKLAADELIRPRRPCVKCGTPLPVWLKGKRVPITRKFCEMCRT